MQKGLSSKDSPVLHDAVQYYFISSEDEIFSSEFVLENTNASLEDLEMLVENATKRDVIKHKTFEFNGSKISLRFLRGIQNKQVFALHDIDNNTIRLFLTKQAIALLLERDVRSVFSDGKAMRCKMLSDELEDADVIGHIAKFIVISKLVLYPTVSYSDVLDMINKFIDLYKETNIDAHSAKIGDKTAYTDDMRWSIKKTAEGNVYYWKNKDREAVHIDVDFADKLFFEFSQHGMNLSSAEVQFRNNISPKMWNTFKSALELYKTSDIFSPHTRDELTTEEYRKLVTEKIDNLELHKRSIVAEVYQKKIMADAKKNQAIAHEKLYNRAIFQDEILEYLTKYDNKDIEVKFTKHITSTGKIRIVIGDLHIGQDIIAEYTKANYNSAVIREMLTEVLADIIEECTEEVELWFMGDAFESITGTMHDGAWKEMEKGKIGAELYKLAHGILKEFILAIPNLTRVRALGGNHDRMTDSWKSDLFGSVADILFFNLSEQLPKSIEILFEPYVMQFQEDGINYILHHGNASAFGKPKDVLSQYGRHDCFNFIIIAHKHHRAIEIDQHNARMIVIPPFTTGNNFSLQSGYSTLPGFTKIKHRLVDGHHALPIVTDVPLARR